MAKKCPVRSLNESALSELANLVVSVIGFALNTDLGKDVSITMVEVNSYLEDAGATNDIYQDLLKVILSSDYLEASIRFTCLQMLLNGSVHCLVTEIFPFSYYEKILQVIAAQGTGLRILNLKGVWIKDEHMQYMFQVIQKCRNLMKLCIPYIANDDLLDVISHNCEDLKIIDISGETDITEIGVEYLSKGVASSKLTVIDIGMLGEENICHTDVSLLLENCPNIETLSTYSFVGQALRFIYENINKEFKCKLRYLHDTKTNAETLEIIVRTCPKIESLYLDTPNSNILHKLNNVLLQKLKIYKFDCNELMELLKNSGRNLVHLTVIKGLNVLDLGLLATLCTCLVDLDCYMMELLSYSSENKFERLQGLEMLNSPMNASALKYFICNSTTLKRLAIDSVTFNDDDIMSIFFEYEFSSLEDIWFTSATNLSVTAIEILMERCPELQSIGQLSGWALTPDDLALIRGLLKSGNSSVVLSPTNLFP